MPEKFPKANSLDSMEGVPGPIPVVELGKNTELSDNKPHFEKPPILEISPDMWQKYKELRLRSGETEPEAWGKSSITEHEKEEGYWREKLSDHNFKMFAVEEDGKIIAMAGLQKKPDEEFFLRQVYVSPEFRGKGFAKMLIEKVLSEARIKGANSINLGVTDGLPAVGLYRSLGFIEIGRNKDKIRGDKKFHDEILMRKTLV